MKNRPQETAIKSSRALALAILMSACTKQPRASHTYPTSTVQVSLDTTTPELLGSQNGGTGGRIILARILESGRVITGPATLRLSMIGGDGQVDNYQDGSYSNVAARDTVIMDTVCFGHPETSTTIVPANSNCPDGFTSAGVFTARLFSQGGTDHLRATAISFPAQPEATLEVR
jgi:hypothetical protein